MAGGAGRRRLVIVVGVVVVAAVLAAVVGVVALGEDDPPVLDADRQEVTSQRALSAVEAWRAQDEDLDEIRVLWEGEADGPFGPTTTVVLAGGGGVVSAVQPDGDGSWNIREGQSTVSSREVLATGTGFLLDETLAETELEIWCPERQDSLDAEPAAGGFLSSIPVDDGLVSSVAAGCVARGSEAGNTPTLWFGAVDDVAVIDRGDPEQVWGTLVSPDGVGFAAAVADALDRIQSPRPAAGVRVQDDVVVEVLGTGPGPQGVGLPEGGAVAVAVRVTLDPPRGSPGAVVAVAVGDSSDLAAYVVGESRGTSPRPVLAASWIGPDQGHEGQPFLLYAASSEVDSLELRVGRRDVDATGLIGFVPLPERAAEGVSELPFSLVGLDEEGFPVSAMEAVTP